MGNRRHGPFGWLLLASLMAGLLAGCGGNASQLDDAVRTLARSQSVDENTVRIALEGAATTEDDQLRVANQWKAQLPDEPLPNLDSTLDDLARYGREQLQSAACDALIDVARTGQVPDGQQFVNQYLAGLVTGSLPMAEVQALIDTFDGLWADAQAGTLRDTDIRLELMRIQYC